MSLSRVSQSMFLRIAVMGLLLASACSKKSDKPTTPTGVSGSAAGAPSADGPSGANGVPDPVGSTGGTAPGEAGGGGDGPAVTLPNLDPDPAQAKVQVDAQLTIAKASLSQATPDADAALRAAQGALAIDASSVEAAAYVAFAYYHKRLYDTAELVLDDLFKREAAKSNAMVYYVYGLIYDKTNRPEHALRAYQKAVELDGRHASAHINLGVHQLRNSQYADAQRTFEKVINELKRSDAITLTSLGSAYRGRSAEYPPGAAERSSLVKQAEATYKRALGANPSYGPAHYNLGLLYLESEPFPGIPDDLQRLNTAKSHFDQYKNMPGVDLKLHESRTKDVDRAIKRAQRKAKPTEP